MSRKMFITDCTISSSCNFPTKMLKCQIVFKYNKTHSKTIIPSICIHGFFFVFFFWLLSLCHLWYLEDFRLRTFRSSCTSSSLSIVLSRQSYRLEYELKQIKSFTLQWFFSTMPCYYCPTLYISVLIILLILY